MHQGYEIRCTEATAVRMKKKVNKRPVGQSDFQAALGMPLVTDERVPDGHIEVRCNGVLVKRYYA